MSLIERLLDRGVLPQPSAYHDKAMREAATQLEAMQAEIDRLREANRDMTDGLQSVSKWREDCHSCDRDFGNEPRDFDSEDWDMVEALARRTLERARESLDRQGK